MERTVKLTLEKAKEWYKKGGELKEVALQAFNERELSTHRSQSWEEFCKNNSITNDEWYVTNVSTLSDVKGSKNDPYYRDMISDKNLYPTKEYAEAALALAQLLQLHKEWVKDWKPSWNMDDYYFIGRDCNYDETVSVMSSIYPRVLSFPTSDMAYEFYNDFENLLEIAKPLL